MWLFYGLLLVACWRIVYSQPCPNDCNSHGRCSSPGKICMCFTGYTGPDCSQRICPFGPAWTDMPIATDKAHNPAECSNNGICDRGTGLCLCQTGFEGKSCERRSCWNGCNKVGECQSMYYYALSKDLGTSSTAEIARGRVYEYSTIWDANMMHGCNCDSRYQGPDCSQRICPAGDDPLTGNGADTPSNPAQYNTIQRVLCRAGGGSFTLRFMGKTTKSIPITAKNADIKAALEALPTIGSNNLKIVMYSSQACTETGGAFTIEFLQAFGSLPMLIGDARQLFFNDALSRVSLTVSAQVAGNKENDQCSNRGICDPSTGYCTCSTNYDTSNGYNAPGIRGDCGFAMQTIQSCPGAVSCSAHGECSGNPTYRCSCADGWTGADCSERVCPKDVSWFARPENADNYAHLDELVECSNMGICDRTSGICTCNAGFTGASCNRLTCPGGAEPCNAHGKCLSMNALAKLSTVNGVLAGYTYGNTPNNPYTWDAFKIYGCYCDEQYMGYDCSMFKCPMGDDPDTPAQLDERQIITCTDADARGTFTLTYKQKVTGVLVTTASTSDVKAALEGLANIRTVAVDVVDTTKPNQLCTPSGNSFSVTFQTEHGDLPLLQPTTLLIDSMTITEDVTGTKEWIECSGRGLCNHITGNCACFQGYGASDGMGGAGMVGDCGYVEPLASAA